MQITKVVLIAVACFGATAMVSVSSGMSVARSATCYTGEKMHQKRVTMTGTVEHIFPQDGGGYAFQTRECPSAAILSGKKNGCRIGSKITATGTYESCSIMILDWDCSADLIDGKSVTCR
jgi:hypothetical protein